MTEAASQMLKSINVNMNLNYADLPCQGLLYSPQPQDIPSRETFLKRAFKGRHFPLSAHLLTDMEESREPVIAALTCGLPHHYPIIPGDGHPLCHWFSLSYTFHICRCPHLGQRALVRSQRKERSGIRTTERMDPVPLPSPGALRKGSDNAGVAVNCSGGHETIGNFFPQ